MNKFLKIILMAVFVYSGLFFASFFVPVNNGSLGMAIINELSQRRQIVQDKKDIITNKEKAKKQKIIDYLSSRFMGPLDFKGESINELWSVGTVANNIAWLDIEYGMIWSEAMAEKMPSFDQESLIKAMQICNNYEPLGFWGLPTQAEMILARKNQIRDIMKMPGKWLYQILMRSSFSGGYAAFWQTRVTEISIRCVAISSKAPRHGYSKDDFEMNYISFLAMQPQKKAKKK
jgi:hypothetical protein